MGKNKSKSMADKFVLGARRSTAGQVGRSLPAYLELGWPQRRKQVVGAQADWLGGDFAKANAAYVRELTLADGENARLHVIFNVGSDALRCFAQSDDYKNVYERPVVEGRTLRPSQTRLRVDRILNVGDPRDIYFCALSVGGTGMRFYGEYCVALRSPDDAAGVRWVLDRNSFDLLSAPLATWIDRLNLSGQQALTSRLLCPFRTEELGDLLSVKVLQQTGARARRLTIGTVGDAVLCDEDYAEAYHQGKIRLAAMLEVRSHPDDELVESGLDARWSRGESLTPEELQWAARRREARKAMEACGLQHRVVSGNGRGQRWR